jgi:hypothetical protein
MDNPGLPAELWDILNGGLWHATSPRGLSSGEIQVIPGRYDSSFAKKHKAVSLFDFGPSSRDEWDQFKNWCGWFGYEQQCRVPVWLKIDREATTAKVLNAENARNRWKENLKMTFIPGVEAIHLGYIHINAVTNALIIDKYEKSLFKITKISQDIFGDIHDFEARLPPEPPENPIIHALHAARNGIKI